MLATKTFIQLLAKIGSTEYRRCRFAQAPGPVLYFVVCDAIET
jgi:hypothetical protein